MHVQSIRDDGKRKPGFLDWAVAEKDPKVSTGQAEFEESVFTSDGLMLISKELTFKAMVGVGVRNNENEQGEMSPHNPLVHLF